MIYKNVTVLFFFISIWIRSNSQLLEIKQYTNKQNLPNQLVYKTFKDTNGFIWCGTEAGLALFQGHSFIPFVHNLKDSNCIVKGQIYSLANDEQSNLWVASYSNGIVIFNPLQNKYLKLTKFTHPELMMGKHINSICNYNKDELIILTSKGAYRINIHTLKTINVLPPENQNDEILSFRILNEKEYFLDYKIGLLEKSNNGTWKKYNLPDSEMNFTGMSECNQKLFVNSFAGTYIFENEKLLKCSIIYEGKDISLTSINDIEINDQNQIYIHSYNLGPLKATYHSRKFQCEKELGNNWFNNGNILYSNYYDSGHFSYFIGTMRGLFIIKKKESLFFELSNAGSLGTIRAMGFLKENLFIGTEDGVFIRDKGDNIKRIKSENTFVKEILVINSDSVLATGYSIELFGDNGVKYKNRLEELISKEENTIVGRKVQNRIIFFTNATKKIIEWDMTKDKFDEYPMIEIEDLVPPAIVISDKVLLLSYTGLFEYSGTTKKIKRILIEDDAMISDMQYYHNRIYFSSSTEGITILDTNYKRIQKIDLSPIVGNNEVRSIQVKDSIIWFATPKGLGYYNMNRNKIAYFKSGENFTTSNFYNSSKTEYKDTIYFGGDNGIVAVNTKAVLAEKIEDKVYLINFSFYKDGILYKVVNPINHTFSFDENNLELQLVHTNTEYPSYFQYQYRLNKTGTFIPIDESGLIKLYNLPPDKYHLEVMEKQSMELMAFYDFTISPPWYQTWWFRSLLGVVILANGIWISRLYFRRRLIAQQKELEKQQALQSERDRISSDMHDDLGSGLSSIKLISEMLKKKHSDTETKSDLNEIVEHATSLTDTMREMVWSLNPRNDTLSKFVDHIIQYSKQFFEPSEISFKVVVKQEFPEITMNGFVRRNLFLCLKEIFNNIIKHAQAKNVLCTISYHEHKLVISIHDDGRGIPESHTQGNGLYSIRKRIADCNGHIEWTNRHPGLNTTIEIPV